MKRKSKILLSLVFVCAFLSQVSAQLILNNGKIPRDLVITYESYNRFCHSELKIKSNRKLLLNLFSCLPLSDAEISRYESAKRYKKLPEEKLKELISEFEKINFFNLNDEYSTRKNSCITFITDSGTTKISIKINGTAKQVFFENGCRNENNTIIQQLRNLGEKINQISNEVKIQRVKNKIKQKK